MYESFYGFSEKPFSLLPDPSYLYLGKKHSMAMAMLQYSLTMQNGFTVLSGEIGSGKTTLIRHLLDKVGTNLTVGLISNTHESFGELLQWVLMAFGLEHGGRDKVECYHLFTDFMINEYANNRRTVLIIDEAQNLSMETLEELRMLSNINADKNQVLQLMLVGQPELRDKLKDPQLKQFAQRISTAYFLDALDEDETRAYIHTRLEKAGGNTELFEDDAIKVIHHYSGGVPRLINTFSDTSLVYGYATGAHQITGDIAKEVVKDQISGGIFEAPPLPDSI